MGFKIESTDELGNIIGVITAARHDLWNAYYKAKGSLYDLPDIISGQNIEGVLNNFREAHEKTIRNLSDAASGVCDFVTQQVYSYGGSEAKILANLAMVESQFDNMFDILNIE